MKKTPRWLKSALAASADAQPSMPWHRTARRQPEMLKSVLVKAAIAAR